jgi:hypothetical protein
MELVSVVQKTKAKQGKLAVKGFFTNDLNSKCRMKEIMRSILEGSLEVRLRDEESKEHETCSLLATTMTN